MARLMRMAGAFLLENSHGYFLIGNFKRPCNFAGYGFERPERDTEAPENPVLSLIRNDLDLCPDPVGVLRLGHSPEMTPEKIAEFFMIQRNGSMSERLWDLVWESTDSQDEGVGRDASWLCQLPEGIWECVRDSVLRC